MPEWSMYLLNGLWAIDIDRGKQRERESQRGERVSKIDNLLCKAYINVQS